MRPHCELCSLPIGDENCLQLPRVLGAGHPLYRFSASVLHWECFERWTDRADFAQACMESVEGYANPCMGEALSLPGLLVQASQSRVFIWFRELGTRRIADLAEWPPPRSPANWHPLERAAWDSAHAQIVAAIPSAERLLAAVDWDAVEARAVRLRAEQAAEQTERDAAVARYNAQMHALRESGCPHCGFSGPLRYLDRRVSRRKSCFMCPACGRSVHLEQL